MRAIVQDDWPAQEQGRTEDTHDVFYWGDQLRGLRYTLPQKTPNEQVAYQQVSAGLSDAGTARQKALADAQPQVPTILWVLVFVSTGLLFFLLVADAQAQAGVVRRIAVGAVVVLMTMEVISLAALDSPYSPIVRVQPTALTQALSLLEAGRQGSVPFQACVIPQGS